MNTLAVIDRLLSFLSEYGWSDLETCAAVLNVNKKLACKLITILYTLNLVKVDTAKKLININNDVVELINVLK